jgi:peroxiredoxin Q/BCP
MLNVGNQAPEFELPDADENLVKLSDFRGKKVILWFFPKANTPG